MDGYDASMSDMCGYYSIFRERMQGGREKGIPAPGTTLVRVQLKLYQIVYSHHLFSDGGTVPQSSFMFTS